MITLGITGSLTALQGNRLRELPDWFFHDAAAAVVVDGVTVAAVEEERLNRIKHTTAFPEQAIRFCLDMAGINPSQIDEVAFFFGEEYTDLELNHQYVERPAEELVSARDLLKEGLERAVGQMPANRPLSFVPHHLSHAFGSWADSGFDNSLVTVVDGNGESESISIYHAEAGALRPIKTYPIDASLGHLYLELLPLMGFKRFDEYKVMGLAPYGDPSVFRKELERFVEFLPNGEVGIDRPPMVEHFLRAGFRPRRKGESFRQADADLAAALQETLEKSMLHLLGHWRAETGEQRLCLSGGVAHNSSSNGRVLTSGLFNEVFVHPASHDAGAALGAAQYRQSLSGLRIGGRRLSHVFWGPDVNERTDSGQTVDQAVQRWSPLLTVERISAGEETDKAAELIAENAVIGWATGRSEFGPRALGHRSILADPRLAENRDRVNAKIKKREGFRPFAPAVLQERAGSVFDLTSTKAPLDFMSFVVGVQPEWRDRLPAVTHVDGTARVQVINGEHNTNLWNIVKKFEERTNVPVVLNTSFNNFAEPVVQSADDVIQCLLTTGLDAVIMPGYLLRRVPDLDSALLSCSLKALPMTRFERTQYTDTEGSITDTFSVRLGVPRSQPVAISRHLWNALADSRARTLPVGDIPVAADDERNQLLAEVMLMWENRYIEVVPTS
ncbi:carbamoyltransferase C-terminal domain-containing protein [Streptomyces sp. NPDC006552]|uniref:carbamoyltransferase family protein n=1 Tax=Streptomyces sp. NPDC006552 TaxID=3157179 RepID=UPI0033A15311